MKQIGLCLLFAVAIQSLCYADITKLPAEDRKVLQDSSRFHEVHSTNDLPPTVIALCAEDGRLAEPGQNWNASDVVTDPNLPGKRLIWAAAGGEYYVVHYERGVARRWRSAQRLRSICRRVAKREVGRPFGLFALTPNVFGVERRPAVAPYQAWRFLFHKIRSKFCFNSHATRRH